MKYRYVQYTDRPSDGRTAGRDVGRCCRVRFRRARVSVCLLVVFVSFVFFTVPRTTYLYGLWFTLFSLLLHLHLSFPLTNNYVYSQVDFERAKETLHMYM